MSGGRGRHLAGADHDVDGVGLVHLEGALLDLPAGGEAGHDGSRVRKEGRVAERGAGHASERGGGSPKGGTGHASERGGRVALVGRVAGGKPAAAAQPRPARPDDGRRAHLVARDGLVHDDLGPVGGEALDLVRHHPVHRLAPEGVHRLRRRPRRPTERHARARVRPVHGRHDAAVRAGRARIDG